MFPPKNLAVYSWSKTLCFFSLVGCAGSAESDLGQVSSSMIRTKDRKEKQGDPQKQDASSQGESNTPTLHHPLPVVPTETQKEIEHSTTIQERKTYAVETRHKAKAFDQRKEGSQITCVVLHCTVGGETSSLNTLTGPNVSAHYLVPQRPPLCEGLPVVYGLVEEKDRAWHAGVSCWQGKEGLNHTSIGIEIVNLGYYVDKNYGYLYTEEQIDAVIRLVEDLVNRYGIHPTCVVSHSDIAPGRKFDPGPLFPWKRLAEKGLCAWPILDEQKKDAQVSIPELQEKLQAYGYKIEVTKQLDKQTLQALRAFQEHFMPWTYTFVSLEGDLDHKTEILPERITEDSPILKQADTILDSLLAQYQPQR